MEAHCQPYSKPVLFAAALAVASTTTTHFCIPVFPPPVHSTCKFALMTIFFHLQTTSGSSSRLFPLHDSIGNKQFKWW